MRKTYKSWKTGSRRTQKVDPDSKGAKSEQIILISTQNWAHHALPCLYTPPHHLTAHNSVFLHYFIKPFIFHDFFILFIKWFMLKYLVHCLVNLFKYVINFLQVHLPILAIFTEFYILTYNMLLKI